MDYWFSPYEIIFMQWPIPVFAVLSGLLLLLTLGGGCGSLLIRGGKENQWQIAYVLLWCFTALVSFLGIVQASCLEYADQMIYYNFGICSFTVAAVMLVQQEKRMIRWIAVAMFCGMILSLISGLHQHFIAFDELEQYLKEQSRLTGTDLLAGKMGISLQERRLTADFGICNIYGGFLMAMLPLAAVMVWRFSRQVKPQNVSRFVKNWYTAPQPTSRKLINLFPRMPKTGR